jgi:hypothetical protein
MDTLVNASHPSIRVSGSLFNVSVSARAFAFENSSPDPVHVALSAIVGVAYTTRRALRA